MTKVLIHWWSMPSVKRVHAEQTGGLRVVGGGSDSCTGNFDKKKRLIPKTVTCSPRAKKLRRSDSHAWMQEQEEGRPTIEKDLNKSERTENTLLMDDSAHTHGTDIVLDGEMEAFIPYLIL